MYCCLEGWILLFLLVVCMYWYYRFGVMVDGWIWFWLVWWLCFYLFCCCGGFCLVLVFVVCLWFGLWWSWYLMVLVSVGWLFVFVSLVVVWLFVLCVMLLVCYCYRCRLLGFWFLVYRFVFCLVLVFGFVLGSWIVIGYFLFCVGFCLCIMWLVLGILLCVYLFVLVWLVCVVLLLYCCCVRGSWL